MSGEASNSVRSDFVGNEGRNFANIEVSTGFNTTKVSQPLAPIGTPAVKSDAQGDLRSQTNKYPLSKISFAILRHLEVSISYTFLQVPPK